MRELDFPTDCRTAVLSGYGQITSGKFAAAFDGFLSEYAENKDLDYTDLAARIEKDLSPVFENRYLATLILYIAMTQTTRRLYKENGISEDIFYRTAADIKYKAMEAKLVKGDWGIFCAPWFGGFFSLKLFAFGNLQFKLISAYRDYVTESVNISKGTPVLEVHIPRTGRRLDHEEVLNSYKQGAEFFKERFAIDEPIFVCASWLLYPKNLEILKPDSNIAKFISDFTIVDSVCYDDYSELWRLFDMDYTGDVRALPADTSFRRGYIDWVKRGEKTGYGVGFFTQKE